MRGVGRTEHRHGRALNCAVIALTADRGRSVIHYHDGLSHRLTGVTAIIRGVPTLGRRVSVPARPSCRGRTKVVHRRATARITRCRRGEARCSRALNGGIVASIADRGRRGVYYRDGLMHLRAGVVASVHRMPGLGARVVFSTGPSG